MFIIDEPVPDEICYHAEDLFRQRLMSTHYKCSEFSFIFIWKIMIRQCQKNYLLLQTSSGDMCTRVTWLGH